MRKYKKIGVLALGAFFFLFFIGTTQALAQEKRVLKQPAKTNSKKADSKKKQSDQSGKVAAEKRKAQRAKDLKWAEGLFDDFVEALKSKKYRLAAGLVSEELVESYKGAGVSESLHHELKSMLSYQYKKWNYTNIRKVTIKNRALSSNGHEAIFQGQFAGEWGAVISFKVRVSRKTEKANWRVSFFHFKVTKYPKSDK